MKRIYVVILFIIIVIITGSFETGYVTAKSDMFISKIENADKLIRKSNFIDAANMCKKIEAEWNESSKSIDMFLIHDYVDSIGISISRLTSYAKTESYDMYFAESVTAKKELASIKESEYPLFENIL